MKRFLILNLLVASLALAPADLWSQPPPMQEPPLAHQTSWHLAPNGMLFVGYDTNHSGKENFHTLRVVTTSYFSGYSVESVLEHNPGNLVFSVNYRTTRFYYIVAAKPLFYVMDVDEDGHWDLIYKDWNEDGVNGNESFYESPSGMFSEPPASSLKTLPSAVSLSAADRN